MEWDEVESALAAGDSQRLIFEPAAVSRVEEKGDLFAPPAERAPGAADSASVSNRETRVRSVAGATIEQLERGNAMLRRELWR